jgi:hypothetical protein
MTKIYIIEEHHEAYLVWWKEFNSEKSIERHLIHIDEHADMGIPTLTKKIPDVKESLSTQLEFVYKNLTVGTFLIPAYISGFFSTLSWIKPSTPMEIEKMNLEYNVSNIAPYILFNGKESISDALQIQKSTWSTSPQHDSWILDICLDSFACLPFPQANHLELEITIEQYTKLSNNELNPWNARYGNLFTTNQRNGKYYAKILPHPLKNIDEHYVELELIKRVNAFNIWLRSLSCTPPDVITIVRSVISGYTPPELVSILERKLLTILKEVFPLSTQLTLQE